MMVSPRVRFFTKDNNSFEITINCEERGTNSSNSNSINNEIRKYFKEELNKDIASKIKCAIVKWEDDYVTEKEIVVFDKDEMYMGVYTLFTVKKNMFEEAHAENKFRDIIIEKW